MKKIILFLFIIPLTIFGQKYQEPDLVNLIDAEYSGMGSNFPEFGLIGWSKDGLFAYREILSNGGIGTYADNIIICNLKNDEIVESFSFSINNEYDWVEYPPGDSPWEYYQRTINRLLSKYEIIQAYPNKFYTSKYIDTYEIILKDKKSKCEGDWGWEFEHEYRLLVGSSSSGYKKVGDGFLECGSSSMNFEGYFKSPFENRIIIVLSSYTLGYESEEDWNLHFFGCSLNPRTF